MYEMRIANDKWKLSLWSLLNVSCVSCKYVLLRVSHWQSILFGVRKSLILAYAKASSSEIYKIDDLYFVSISLVGGVF